MEVIKIVVTGNIARATEKPEHITAGTVGLQIDFSFDGSWEGLNKIAVFRGGNVVKDRQIINGAPMTVPHEVMAKACDRLVVGVEGRSTDGTIVIPTTYANICNIIGGANAFGDAAISEPPTNIYDDIMAAIDAGKMKGEKGDSYIRDISTGTLSKTEEETFKKIYGEGFLRDPIFLLSNSLNGFSTWAYKQIGVNVGGYFSTVHNTFIRMFDAKKDADGYRYRKLTVEEGADPYCLAMLVEGSYSGKNDNMQHYGYEYTMELKDYKIGDIFCMRYSDYLDGVWGDSCYYMALYKAQNTFILYQDFGPHEQETNPSNVREIDYTGLLNIIDNAESVYYYVMRPENIAIMDVMESEARQEAKFDALRGSIAEVDNALKDSIAEVDKKNSEEIAAIEERIDEVSGKLRDLNVGKLTAAEKSAIVGLGETDGVGKQMPNLAVWAYTQAGIDVSAYIKDSISNIYWSLFPSNSILTTDKGNYLTMLVPKSYGGTKFQNANKPNYALDVSKYQIGDIFCGKFGSSYWAAAYQGDEKFVLRDSAAVAPTSVISFSDISANTWEYYFVLRPENIAIEDTLSKVPVGMVTRTISVNDNSDSLEAQIDTIYASMADSSTEIVELGQAFSTAIGTGSNWMLMITKTNANYGAIIAWQYGHPVVIKTRGRVAGNWGGWNQITVASGDIITSTNWPQYINVSGGGSSASGMLEEFEATQTTGTNSNKIVKSGNTYTFTTPGNSSKLYNLTVRCIGINGSTDPDDLSSLGYFNSLTVGWKQVVAACTDPSIGEYYMAVPCFNPAGAFEGVAISASYNSSTGRITFQLTSKTWELYHIRGLY